MTCRKCTNQSRTTVERFPCLQRRAVGLRSVHASFFPRLSVATVAVMAWTTVRKALFHLLVRHEVIRMRLASSVDVN